MKYQAFTEQENAQKRLPGRAKNAFSLARSRADRNLGVRLRRSCGRRRAAGQAVGTDSPQPAHTPHTPHQSHTQTTRAPLRPSTARATRHASQHDATWHAPHSLTHGVCCTRAKHNTTLSNARSPLCAGRWVFCAAFVSRSARRVSRAAPTASLAANLAALTASLAASRAAPIADLIGAQGGPTERSSGWVSHAWREPRGLAPNRYHRHMFVSAICFANNVASASGAQHLRLALALLVPSIHVFSHAVPSADQTSARTQRPGSISSLLSRCLCRSAEDKLPKCVHIHAESKKTVHEVHVLVVATSA